MSVMNILIDWPHAENLGNKFLEVETAGLAFTHGEVIRMRAAGFHQYAEELEQKVEKWHGEIWDEFDRFTWGRGAR